MALAFSVWEILGHTQVYRSWNARRCCSSIQVVWTLSRSVWRLRNHGNSCAQCSFLSLLSARLISKNIAQPRCFRVLEELRKTMSIPVWHDDQQGSATALLAGLIGALKCAGKQISSIRIAMIGMGAANVAMYRLLKAYGVDSAQIVACDSRGTLHRNCGDIEERQVEFAEKWAVCRESNTDRVTGGIEQALRGADVCIAFARSDPKLIDPAWIRTMAKRCDCVRLCKP